MRKRPQVRQAGELIGTGLVLGDVECRGEQLDDALQAGDDQQERYDAAGYDDRNVEWAAAHPFGAEDDRRQQPGGGQQDQPAASDHPAGTGRAA